VTPIVPRDVLAVQGGFDSFLRGHALATVGLRDDLLGDSDPVLIAA